MCHHRFFSACGNSLKHFQHKPRILIESTLHKHEIGISKRQQFSAVCQFQRFRAGKHFRAEVQTYFRACL